MNDPSQSPQQHRGPAADRDNVRYLFVRVFSEQGVRNVPAARVRPWNWEMSDELTPLVVLMLGLVVYLPLVAAAIEASPA